MSKISRVFCGKYRNFYLSFAFGLLITIYWPSSDRSPGYYNDRCAFQSRSADTPEEQAAQPPADAVPHEAAENDFEPQLNLAQKPLSAKKELKSFIRPRYYSSELGIREKLFVGCLSEQNHIETLATAFNRTNAHLVNKIKFFINADNVKSTFKLKNIVGFTDTRENLRPFHVLKYIADNYLDDFDYFLLVPDTSYLNSRAVRQKVSHLSISFDIYLGTPMAGGKASDEDVRGGSYCDLNSGIVFSSSVIRKIRANLDWCVREAKAATHSENIGRCVKYATGIDLCQTSWQGVSVKSYQLEDDHQGIYRDFNRLSRNSEFNEAALVYPVRSADDFYRLHLYFSRLHLEETNRKLIELEQKSQTVSNGSIRNDILEVRWPVGVPPESVPETRFDVSVWTAMNRTHSFNYDPETNVKKLSKVDAMDIEKILNRTLILSQGKHPNLRFKDIHSIYRRFDPVRGMDYKVLLNFKDDRNGNDRLIGYEAMKPLGMVEIIPSPYVTESTKIAILLPTFEHQVQESLNFMARYEKTCMANQDNTFLMLVFLYGPTSPSKGDGDVYGKLKDAALKMSDKYKVDGSRIAWVSIRLPDDYTTENHPIGERVVMPSMFAGEEVLSLAVADLSLRKIGLETLVMIASNSMNFRADYLNRVRMNTIQGFQVFSPIGFQAYPCMWTGLCRDCPTCDVGQHLGYFDRQNVDVISFYSRDYVEARKKLEARVPIIRSDKDIPTLWARSDKGIKTVLDVFVKAKTAVHVLRAVEPNLRFGEQVANYLMRHHQLPQCPAQARDEGKCIRVASKKQFGEILIQMLDKAEVSG